TLFFRGCRIFSSDDCARRLFRAHRKTGARKGGNLSCEHAGSGLAAMVITLVGDYLAAIAAPEKQLGLDSAPATPCYLGQPELKSELAPELYRPGIKPELEREMLREYRQLSAEFAPANGLTDWQLLVSAHLAGVPSRILEWSGNPLVALFFAAESMSAETGRVWVLNPWAMNEQTANMAYVPPVESDYFKKYAIKLGPADQPALPEALQPM